MTPAVAKRDSHDFLHRHAIDINEALPFLETMDELHPQDAQSVARRIVVLNHVIGVVGFGAPADRLRASLEAFGLFQNASAREQELLSRTGHSQQEKTDALWLAECVQSLAWCLGLAGLDPFRRCDNNLASYFPRPFANPSGFISGATLRPMDEIYQQADLHYRLHWAARNARLMGQRSKVDEQLTAERRKGLDWVIGVEANWDEISLDT